MSKSIFSWQRVLPLLSAAVLLTGVLAFVGARDTAKAQSSQAVVDYFLKLDGIEGESTDDKHKNEIELQSFSWGESKPGLLQTGTSTGGGGAGAGKVQVNDFHFQMRSGKASPQLMLHTASGKHIKEAVLTARKAGKEQQDFYKVTLKDVLVTSYQTSGETDQVPTDQFSLNFATVEMELRSQKADGSFADAVKAGWNFKENKAL